MIDLAHSGVDAYDNPGFPGILGKCEQGAHSNYRQIAGQGQPLRYAAGDTQSCKCARTFAIGDPLNAGQRQSGIGKQSIQLIQQDLRMTLLGENMSRKNLITRGYRQ